MVALFVLVACARSDSQSTDATFEKTVPLFTDTGAEPAETWETFTGPEAWVTAFNGTLEPMNSVGWWHDDVGWLSIVMPSGTPPGETFPAVRIPAGNSFLVAYGPERTCAGMWADIAEGETFAWMVDAFDGVSPERSPDCVYP